MALAVTLGRAASVQASPATTPATTAQVETVHTTANHPWLTADRGWVEAGELRPGEPVVTLSGATTATETVAWVQVVAGQADMYNLTVAQDHTYAVGDGHAVVHNDCGPEGLQGMTENVQARQQALQASGSTYTAGGMVIRDTETGEVLFEGGPYDGNNRLPAGANHAENQGINDAVGWLGTQARAGGSGNVTVDILTARNPCEEYCQPSIASGTWLGRLQIAGQAEYDIQLRIWRVWNSGPPQLLFAQE